MEHAINPDALKALRKSRGWSQVALAKKCGFHGSAQVSRWERGKSLRLRSNSREKLSRAFGVSWDQLTQAPSNKDDMADLEEALGRVQINVRVSRSDRNALQLVCLRYNLRPADVMRLAPLLFLIIAEKSLVHRQENHDAIEESVCQTVNENRAAAPHLSTDLIQHGFIDEVLSSEQDSISRRDVFGNHVQLQNFDGLYHGPEDLNPFLNYLNILKADIPSELVTDISTSEWQGDIAYTIADETLREVTQGCSTRVT